MQEKLHLSISLRHNRGNCGSLNYGESDSSEKHNGGTIAQNKRARHDYFIEEKFEAGMSLLGWEVKSLRAGRMSLTESYVIFKNGEAFLFGAQIQPLLSASTHVVPEATRTRKLLLSRRELEKLTGSVNQKVTHVFL